MKCIEMLIKGLFTILPYIIVALIVIILGLFFAFLAIKIESIMSKILDLFNNHK